MKTGIVILTISLIFALSSCKNEDSGNGKNTKQISRKEIKEAFIHANKRANSVESEMIERYIERHKWNMTKTESGLRYNIYHKGEGLKAKQGLICRLNYTVKLLDGTICYSSEDNGYKEFILGKGNVESGLEEGVLLLHVGDKARFILPSHLAYGLIGDNNKIKGRSSIIYDVELVELFHK